MKEGLLLPILFLMTCSLRGQEVDTLSRHLGAAFEDVESDQTICLQFDENLFLCNWVTGQTFAYWNEKVTPNGNHVLELVKSDEKFCLPIYGKLWSVFKKGHNGLDINLRTGDTIRATFDGKVRYAMYNKGGFGNLIIIRHYNGLETYYAHLSKFRVSANDEVKAGQVIGLGGSTGRSKGPHLHFEVRYKDKPLDPFSFIDYENKSLKTTELELSHAIFEPWLYGHHDTQHVSNNAAAYTTDDKSNHQKDTTEIKTNPLTTPPSSNPAYHTIKQGDTLYALSLRYKTTVKKICELNKMKETDILQIGRKIRIK